MPSTIISQRKSKSITTRQHTSRRLCKNECNITHDTKVNINKVRKVTPSGNINKYNSYRYKAEEEMLFQYKQKSLYKKKSSRNRQRDDLSKDTTKGSTMFDSDSFSKKRVSFTKPFVEVIKIQSYKQYNLFQTHRKTKTDANNTHRENKIGCSCLIC